MELTYGEKQMIAYALNTQMMELSRAKRYVPQSVKEGLDKKIEEMGKLRDKMSGNY